MRNPIWIVLLAVFMASPAVAQDKSVRVGIGYGFAAYLEDGGGSAPLGIVVSVASTGPIGIEADLAYHRDSEYSLVLNTFTGMLGPRFSFKSESARPFLHVLGGVRYDEVSGYDNAAVALEVGGGVEVPTGSSVFVRLGADFQVAVDEGETFKVLRLTGGIAF